MGMTNTATPQAPTQHCDHCRIGPFFYVSGREYPTLCLDCAAIASAEGLLTFTDKGTTWFPSSATNAAIRRSEMVGDGWPPEALADPPQWPFNRSAGVGDPFEIA